jgi:uncharacterized protein (DUF58 family)
MPKSSRKSWTSSKSQAKSTAIRGGQSQNVPVDRSKNAAGNVVENTTPFAPPKIDIKLKLGKSFTLRVQTRLLVALFVAGLLWVYAALVANEWIYLLASGFLAIALLGVIWPFLIISQIQVEANLPEEVENLEHADLEIRIKKDKRLFLLSLLAPIKSLEIVTNLIRRGNRKRQAQKMLNQRPFYVANLQEQVLLTLATPELPRGIYGLDDLSISTWFPFGIACVARRHSLLKDIRRRPLFLTVYPKTGSISGNFLLRLEGMTSSMGLASSISQLVPQSSSVRSIREFRFGDSTRHIHWASTARMGQILVREFDAETLPVFDLYIDLRANWLSEEQFEFAVLTAHSLVHLGHSLGIMPELIINPAIDSQSCSDLFSDLPKIPPGLHLISEILARVEPVSWAEADERSANPLFAKFSEGGRPLRPILSITPGTDKIFKHSPEHGDRIVNPINIELITSLLEEVQESDPSRAKVQFKVARQKSEETERAVFKTFQSVQLATLADEQDLRSL